MGVLAAIKYVQISSFYDILHLAAFSIDPNSKQIKLFMATLPDLVTYYHSMMYGMSKPVKVSCVLRVEIV